MAEKRRKQTPDPKSSKTTIKVSRAFRDQVFQHSMRGESAEQTLKRLSKIEDGNVKTGIDE